MRPILLLLAVLPLCAAGDPARGRAIAGDRTRGLCTLCHALPGVPGPQGDLAPDLSGIGARAGADELRQRITDPRESNPDTIMPAFGRTAGLRRVGAAWQDRPILSPNEIEDVVAFLLTLRD